MLDDVGGAPAVLAVWFPGEDFTSRPTAAISSSIRSAWVSPVLILSMQDDPRYEREAFDAGASGLGGAAENDPDPGAEQGHGQRGKRTVVVFLEIRQFRGSLRWTRIPARAPAFVRVPVLQRP